MADQSSLKGIVRLYENKSTNEAAPVITGSVLIPFDLVNLVADDPDSIVELGDTRFLKVRIALWEADDKENAAAQNEPIYKGSIQQHKKSAEYKKEAPARTQGMKRKLT